MLKVRFISGGIAAIGLENVSKQHPSESRFQRCVFWFVTTTWGAYARLATANPSFGGLAVNEAPLALNIRG